jgi:acetyltransferase-like isoleucine patch superfamily enzyme
MEIVLATNGLVGIDGSETYLLTVAEHLQRLGHEVTVHAVEGGTVAGDHSTIRERLVSQAGVFCGPRLIVPPRTVVVGAPARALREVRDDELAG